MNDLPSRHEAKRFVFKTFTDDNDALVPTIVRAYAIGDLMTREEWTKTLNMEAAIREARDDGFKYEYIEKYMDGILAAALEKNNE